MKEVGRGGRRRHQFCNWRILCSRGRHILWRSSYRFLVFGTGIRLQSVSAYVSSSIHWFSANPIFAFHRLFHRFQLCIYCGDLSMSRRRLTEFVIRSRVMEKRFGNLSVRKKEISNQFVVLIRIRIKNLSDIERRMKSISVTFRSCCISLYKSWYYSKLKIPRAIIQRSSIFAINFFLIPHNKVVRSRNRRNRADRSRLYGDKKKRKKNWRETRVSSFQRCNDFRKWHFTFTDEPVYHNWPGGPRYARVIIPDIFPMLL